MKQYLEALKDKILTHKLNLAWKSPKVLGGTIIITLLLGSAYFSSTNSAVYVVVNGEKVGLVANKIAAESLLNQILSEKGAPLGTVAKTHDAITYTPAGTTKDEYTALTKEALAKDISYYVDAVQLVVNKKPIFFLASPQDADKLLTAYKDFYAQPSDKNQLTSVEFEGEVKTERVEATLDAVLSFEQALEKLKQGNLQKEEYIVKANDSWWLIARKNDMKTKEVLASNPGANEDTVLKLGQKVILNKVTPYLTVVSKGVRTDIETIPFDVVTNTVSSLPSGQSNIKQSGSDGKKEVQYSYVKNNDKVVSQTVQDEKILEKAVSQVIEQGPQRAKVMVAYSRGSGSLASGLSWPLRGRITSYYGYRGSDFHTGIDIDGDTGDPYVAAASGTVVSAGWNGNYGYSILIDHGNGIMTRYGHSSKLLVSAGSSVTKGQTIGLVGSTGRSTGSHLHVEVIINGDTTNPLSYLR